MVHTKQLAAKLVQMLHRQRILSRVVHEWTPDKDGDVEIVGTGFNIQVGEEELSVYHYLSISDEVLEIEYVFETNDVDVLGEETRKMIQKMSLFN